MRRAPLSSRLVRSPSLDSVLLFPTPREGENMNARRRTTNAAAAAAGIHVFVPGEGENGLDFTEGDSRN